MGDRLNSRGRYIYGSDPNLPLERTADPVDWFHVILRLAMIGATAGVVAYAMGWLS